MFSKYARVTSLGSKCLNFNPKQSSPQSFKWSGALLTQSQSVRLMSKSIADEILQAKQEQEKQEKEQKKESEGNSKKEYKPLTKWQKIGFYFAGIGAPVYLIAMAYLFSTPDRDEHGNDIVDEFSSLPFFSQRFQRLKSFVYKTKTEFEEPFSEKLLPDPLPPGYIQPKYTVCIELTGLLVHASWSHKHGWRFQKRPGLDLFLSQVGYPNFELVIFTVENGITFMNIVERIDPQNQYINYKLFRDATTFINNHPTKDVNSLNRDPKRVIIVDWNKDSTALSKDNALILPKWEGDTTDTSLMGLAQLLQTISHTDVDDVRDVLTNYKHHENPIEVFRENQRRYQEELASQEENKTKVQTKPLVSGLSFLRRR